jgi:hyperosmotically inducible protein
VQRDDNPGSRRTIELARSGDSMKATRTHVAALSMLAAATLLVACEKKTTVTDTPAGTAATTTTTTTMAPSDAASSAMAATTSAMNKAGDAVGDAAITAKVKTKFLADSDVKGLSIDVDTKDGVVTLSGSADKAGNVDKAVAIATGTEGVKSVENKLTVK